MKSRFLIFFYVFALLFVMFPLVSFSQGGNKSSNKNEEKSNVNPQVPAVNNIERSEKVIAEPSRTALSGSYYSSQSYSLKESVLAAPYVASGWMNYYKSERFASFTSSSNDISPAKQAELDAILSEMKKYVADSYEFHYLTYLNGNHNVDLFPHLARAYELNPSSTEILDDFIAYYELTGNNSKKKEFCRKLYDTKEVSPDVMEYNYNVLSSLEPNAVLFTHGEMDTYPVWIWQLIKSTRPDVNVIYLDLMEKEKYRSAKLKELGITVSSPFSNKSTFLNEMASSIKRPVYFANTLAPALLRPVADKLYLTGLAFRFSPAPIDNVGVIKTNWETKFQKEQLLKKSVPGTLHAKMNMNYIPAMILLIENYRASGEKNKADETEKLAIRIASEAGKEQQVRQLLNK